MRVLPDLAPRRPLLVVAVGHFVRELLPEPRVRRVVRVRAAREVPDVEPLLRLLLPPRTGVRKVGRLPLLRVRLAVNEALEPVALPGLDDDLGILEGRDHLLDAPTAVVATLEIGAKNGPRQFQAVRLS